jgi:hypothetical protein
VCRVENGEEIFSPFPKKGKKEQKRNRSDIVQKRNRNGIF